MKSFLLAGLIALLFSGCGWHLRGSGESQLSIDSLYLSSSDSYSAFNQQFRRALAAQGITLSDSPGDAEYTLSLGQEKRDRRTISVANDALASEYELTYGIRYRLEKDGEVLLPSTVAEVSRTYEFDRNAIVAKSEEQELIYREMQADVIQQILRRLRFATESKAVGDTQP